jgi:hypothetical protein
VRRHSFHSEGAGRCGVALRFGVAFSSPPDAEPYPCDGVEDVPRPRQELVTGRQELNALRSPQKERHSQLMFQTADLSAEWRLRNV